MNLTQDDRARAHEDYQSYRKFVSSKDGDIRKHVEAKSADNLHRIVLNTKLLKWMDENGLGR